MINLLNKLILIENHFETPSEECFVVIYLVFSSCTVLRIFINIGTVEAVRVV